MREHSCTDCRFASISTTMPQIVVCKWQPKERPKSWDDPRTSFPRGGLICLHQTNCPTWEKEESDGHSDKAQ